MKKILVSTASALSIVGLLGAAAPALAWAPGDVTLMHSSLSNVCRGGTSTLTVTVATQGGARDVNLQAELTDQNGHNLPQINKLVHLNDQGSVTVTFTSPILQKGMFKWSLGIFDTNWQLMHWMSNIQSFTVGPHKCDPDIQGDISSHFHHGHGFGEEELSHDF